MRTSTVVLFFLFLHLGLAAQSAVSVLRTSGQVLYYAHDGATPIALSPGMELEPQGKLQCKDAGSAKLIYNGTTFVVTGNKPIPVQEVVKSANKASQMSFTGRFFSFLSENLKGGASPGDLEKHHRNHINKVSGGIKGWSQPTYSIRPLLFTTGKLPAANVVFKWRQTAGQGPYTFRLLAENGTQIAQLLTRDTVVTLDLDQLALRLEEEYTWQVSRGENAKSVSVPFELSAASVEDKQQALARDPAFVSADPMEQALMLAFSLEQERCFYSANNTYQQVLLAEPDNALLRKIYATFLARMDMLGEAQILLFDPH